MSLKEKVVNKADASFVDEWRNALKWLSVQWTMALTLLVTYITTDPIGYAKLMETIPQEIRIPLGLVLTGVIPIYLRLKNQGSANNG